MTRAQMKKGSGKGVEVAYEHFCEVVGSRDFYIYVAPHSKPKGYDGLKTFLQEQGCQVNVSNEAPMLPAKDFQAVKVTVTGGQLISEPALKRAHRWAHQRNYLHSFFKPLKGG